MPRTEAIFAAVFDDLAQSVGRSTATLSETEHAKLVRHLNAGYRAAWSYGGVPWEDSWEEGELTVTDGVIDFAEIDDAHVWNFWSADPRQDSRARWVESNTAKAGIWVGTGLSSVFGFWRPVCPQWDGEDDEAGMIALLSDATQAFAQSEHWRAVAQFQTAGERRKDAKLLCDDLAEAEFSRLESKWWLKRKA